MGKKILFICVLILLGYSQNVNSQEIVRKKTLDNTGFKNGFSYGVFTSNDKYIVWLEFFSGQISILNLESNKLDKVKLSRGRGPHEYITVSDLSLTEDHKLIIVDPGNIKFLIYDISNNKYTSDVKFDNIKPFRIATSFNSVITLDISSSKSLYYYLNKDWSSKAFNMTSYKIVNEFKNIFEKEGYFITNSTYGIHLTRYFPNIYITNLKKRRLAKKITFDEVEVKDGRVGTYKGKKAKFPPNDINFLTMDISKVPKMENFVFILAKGEGEKREYNLNQLRVFNFDSEKFTDTLNLGVKATEITVSGNKLFVYSKEENEIFQYEIIPSK